VKISLRANEKIFPIKLRNFKLWKMPELLNSRFPEERYFLNFANTELKRSSEIKFSVSEWQCWAVMG